jgi:cob(I)alamin adenosyltransferase
LDEILGLIDLGIISVEDIIRLITLRDDYTRLVLTGQNLPQELLEYADVISKIDLEKDTTQ